MSAEYVPEAVGIPRDGAASAQPADSVREEDTPHRRLAVRELLEILTAAALVVYGAVHFGDYAFYARLGVSPDAVGLDYGRTLSAVAVGLALFVAAIALLMTAGALFGPAGQGGHAARVGSFLLGVVACACGGLLLKTLLPPVSAVVLTAGVGGIVAAGAALDANSAALRAWASGLGGRAILALAAPAIVLVFGLAGLAGYHAAGYVYHGAELPCGCSQLLGRNITLPWVSGSRGFMGVEAERAEVRWVNPGAHRAPLPFSPIYLGTADDMVVLYDPDAHRAVRIPAQSITVETTPRVISWKEPR